MAAPSHRILRQTIAISGVSAADAAGLQAAVRESFFRDLLPAIDEALTARSAPGRVYRIDRLEIDLGRVPGGAVDEAGLSRFRAELGTHVAAAIDGAEPADSDLELWLHFLEFGALPWWADATDPRLPTLALTRLLSRPTRQWLPSLRQAVATRSTPSAALRRLARAFDDESLVALLAAALGATGGVQPSMSDLKALTVGGLALLASAPGGADSLARLRALWWEHMLGAVLMPGDGALQRPMDVLLPAVLEGLAAQLGSDLPKLAQQALSLRASRAGQAAGASVPSTLWRALGLDPMALPAQGDEPAQATAPALRAAAERLAAMFDAWQQRSVGAGDELWAALAAAAQRLPADAVLRWQGPAASVGQPAIEAVAALIDAALDRNLIPVAAVLRFAADEPATGAAPQPAIPGWPADAVAALRVRLAARLPVDSDASPPAAAAGPTPAARAAPAVPVRAAPQRHAPVDPRFADADALYIDNAGLVVLWPFIGSLFQRLGLVEAGAFKDEAAAMRGAGLLQLLALGDASPPEFALPLNKLLCGLAVDAVFDFGEPVTELEAEECEAMLVAAISRATILREMSVDGFRASFVLRRGQLSARDGHWLLRVERETHDIVLDRFPWGVGLVKLPWMPALLQVEW